jgi:hypothetical protein
MLDILETHTLSGSTTTPTNGHLTSFKCSAHYRSNDISKPSLLIGPAGVVRLVYCYNCGREWFPCLSQSHFCSASFQSSYCSTPIPVSCSTTSGVLDIATLSERLRWDSHWLTDYFNRKITSACTYFHVWRSHSGWKVVLIVILS